MTTTVAGATERGGARSLPGRSDDGQGREALAWRAVVTVVGSAGPGLPPKSAPGLARPTAGPGATERDGARSLPKHSNGRRVKDRPGGGSAGASPSPASAGGGWRSEREESSSRTR